MALTSFQFSWLADHIGTLGVFALSIGWEHLMLLVKYIMQLTVSTMPASVENEVRKKKYEQERKRYNALRAKKERRSGSVDISGLKMKGSAKRENSISPKSLKVNSSFKTSPCSPIRESFAESSSQPSPEKPVEISHKNDKVVDKKSHGAKGQVPSSVLEARRRNISSRKQDYHSIGKHLGGLSSSKTKQENSHPNLEEAISKLPWPPHPSREISPLQAQNYHVSKNSPKYMPTDYLENKIGGAPNPSTSQEHESKIFVEVPGRSCLHQNYLSPSSSLSTVPGNLPTPCHLNLESDDDTLFTTENNVTSVAPEYYPEATAPPLSPSKTNSSSKRTLSSGLASFGDYSKDFASKNGDDNSGTKAKWGVHHILHYANSESLSVRKKSR